MHTCMHTCIHTCMHAYIHTHTYRQTDIYTYVYVTVHVYVYEYIAWETVRGVQAGPWRRFTTTQVLRAKLPMTTSLPKPWLCRASSVLTLRPWMHSPRKVGLCAAVHFRPWLPARMMVQRVFGQQLLVRQFRKPSHRNLLHLQQKLFPRLFQSRGLIWPHVSLKRAIKTNSLLKFLKQVVLKQRHV